MIKKSSSRSQEGFEGGRATPRCQENDHKPANHSATTSMTSVTKVRSRWDIIILGLTLFDQLSFQLLIPGREVRVKLTHFFVFIFQGVDICHPLHCHLEELILGFGMSNKCLQKGKS
jgi:hypothetical protein